MKKAEDRSHGMSPMQSCGEGWLRGFWADELWADALREVQIAGELEAYA